MRILLWHARSLPSLFCIQHIQIFLWGCSTRGDLLVTGICESREQCLQSQLGLVVFSQLVGGSAKHQTFNPLSAAFATGKENQHNILGFVGNLPSVLRQIPTDRHTAAIFTIRQATKQQQQ